MKMFGGNVILNYICIEQKTNIMKPLKLVFNKKENRVTVEQQTAEDIIETKNLNKEINDELKMFGAEFLDKSIKRCAITGRAL